MSSLLSSLATILPIVALAFVLLIGLVLLSWLAVKLYNFRRVYRQDVVYLELTPPAWTDRIPQSTEQLFDALHGLLESRNWRDHLLGREYSLSLEIVSTKAEGIRYLLRIPEHLSASVEKAVIAYLPDVKVKQTQGYFKEDLSKSSRILNYRQKGHFAFPLKSYENLSQQDPMGYLTNAMTKLGDNELMAMQLVISPDRNKDVAKMGYQILSNEDLLSQLDKQRAPIKPKLFSAINRLLFGIMDAIGDAYHGRSQFTYYGAEHYSRQRELEHSKQVANRMKPARQLSYFEQELVQSIHDKLTKPLFKTELRVLLAVDSKQEIKQRKRSFDAAIKLLSLQNYQGLKADRIRFGLGKRIQLLSFIYRLPALRHSSNSFATSELASLFHFPHSRTAKTENVVKSLSKVLPAPVALKNGTKPDVVLGMNSYHGTHTPIGLTKAERERHVYIIGGTGNGKTTMLTGSIVQDILDGKGVAVIDPHGDLATSLLKHIPPERMDDVIYLNPRDIDHPIALNLLELPKGLTGSDLEHEKDLITESVISVLRKVFSEDDSGGHRIEYVLRNTIHTAMTVEGATLFTILKLLTNGDFRKEVSDKLEDQELRDFWKEELGKAGAMQRVKMSAGVTNKIGRFSRSLAAKKMLDQPHSSINFDDILNGSKILICNFSKGRLGEDTSSLFGTAILAQIQLAAWRRESLKQDERTPFYLYVDEFQNFAGKPFMQIISEARKYKVFLTMAEQSTSQQDERQMVETILNNVGTVVCFRTGSPQDEKLLLHQLSPFVEPGDITNLPSYNFYIRIAAVEPYEPMSGQTMLLDSEGSEAVAQKVIANSQAKYSVEHKHAEKEVVEVKPIPKNKPAKKRVKEPEVVLNTKPQGSISA